MAVNRSALGRALLWGIITAALYWVLFHYADAFQRLAHTTPDACAIQENGQTVFYEKATPDPCAADNGDFIEGNPLFVLAPIAMALMLSYTHGLFTGLFWGVVGLKAKDQQAINRR